MSDYLIDAHLATTFVLYIVFKKTIRLDHRVDTATIGVTMRNSWALLFAAFCLALPSPEVEARKGFGSVFKLGRGAKVANSAKHYSSNTLTVEQLKACLLLEQKVDSSEKNLNTKKKIIGNQEKKIKQLEHEVSSLKSYLGLNKNSNFYTQEQVDSFNRKVERYNQMISQHNNEFKTYKKIEAGYNSTIARHNPIVSSFQSSCAGKRYYEDDLIAAKSSVTN